MLSMKFTDGELELLIEALGRLRVDKVEALAVSKENNMPFGERDFGIPLIDDLLARVETVYNAE
jgi:hypothetical protein